jgi:hypothetical protein
MIVLLATVLCFLVWRGRWRTALGATAIVVSILFPVVAAVGALGLGALIVVRRVVRPITVDDDEALLAELTELGLTSGLTFTAAVEAATAAVPGEASTRLRRAGRRDRGTADGTEDDPGLLVVARRALSTGAPLLPAVAGYASTLRNEERSRQLNAARRLPVKLLFPLALLILPGFLMLTVGPAILGGLERLGL